MEEGRVSEQHSAALFQALLLPASPLPLYLQELQEFSAQDLPSHREKTSSLCP